MAALVFVGRGRCYWPECLVKICVLEDGQYTYDCVRAHIEAAEPNGPRWNAMNTDEERRLPENLMWLCLKHHTIVDKNAAKYTVEILKNRKLVREAEDPSMRYINGLTEQRLQEVIDESMDRLIDQLDDLGLPGMDVAEMLVVASHRMPGEDIASMLVHAGDRLPTEDVAGMLITASQRMPSEDVASMLDEASWRMPTEDVAGMLMRASEKMPGRDFLSELDDRIRSLESVARDLHATPAKTPAMKNPAQKTEPPQNVTATFAKEIFWSGVSAALAILIIGFCFGLWVANR